MTKWNLTQESKIGLTSKNPLICVTHKTKVEIQVITSVDTVKAYDKIQHPFMIQILSKLGREGNFINL